ncbi:MAG: hypothetical protein IJ449_11560 [Clostridia bacterium]|nr:hypothetical protein [Clostridia bacterium]
MRREEEYAPFRHNAACRGPTFRCPAFRYAAQGLFVLGFFCITAAFAGERTALVFLLSCAAHEAGHLLVMMCGGVPVRGMTFAPGGAVLCGDFSHCSYAKEAFVHAAGICVNLLLCILASAFRCETAAAVNALLTVYNLLPLRGHDGERLLRAASLAFRRGTETEQSSGLLHAVSVGTEALVSVFGAWLFWFCTLRGVNPVLCGMLFFLTAGKLIQTGSCCGKDEDECPPSVFRCRKRLKKR